MNAQTQSREITLRPVSMPMSRDIEEEFNLTSSQWRVLVDQIFPNAKTQEAVAMALAYCKTRRLDVFKRPVHIVPMYSTALKKEVETVWPGISEVRTTAARTGEYAGIDEVVYGPEIEREFVGEKDKWENNRKVGTEKVTRTVRFPKWASVVVYRWVKGEKASFHTKIFWEETYAAQGKLDVPNAMWAKRPYGQFDKCVEAAALRKAFPEELGNTYAAEEMEGRTIDHDIRGQSPETPAKPPAPPRPPQHEDVGGGRGDGSGETQSDQQIEDAVVVHEKKQPVPAPSPDDENRTDFDTAAWLQRLDEALAQCSNADEIVEAWNEADVLPTLEGDDDAIAVAKSYKRKHTERVSKVK